MRSLICKCPVDGGFDYSLLIAVLSFALSLVAAVITYFQSKKSQKHALEETLFSKVLKDYLAEKIPTAKASIFYDKKGRLQDPGNLANIINDLRLELKYYTYADPIFHKSITRQMQEIEDYIVESRNKTFSSTIEQTRCNDEITKRLHELYSTISKRYL